MRYLRKRSREHLRLQGTGRRLGADHALHPGLQHLGTLAVGVVIGRQVPNREHQRSRKPRERTRNVILLRQGIGIQITRIVFLVLTSAAIEPPHAIDAMLTIPGLRKKGGIRGVAVVAAAIGMLGDHEVDQSDRSIDVDQGVGQLGGMTGGGLAALRVTAVITTHLTGDQDRHAGGALIAQIDVTHRGRLDGGSRDLSLA
jgi:hypothetical protein